jgi:hypothetical protein
MDKAILVGIGAILITVIGGFAGTMLKLGHIEERMDILWKWYVDEHDNLRRRNRRFGDIDTADDSET